MNFSIIFSPTVLLTIINLPKCKMTRGLKIKLIGRYAKNCKLYFLNVIKHLYKHVTYIIIRDTDFLVLKDILLHFYYWV